MMTLRGLVISALQDGEVVPILAYCMPLAMAVSAADFALFDLREDPIPGYISTCRDGKRERFCSTNMVEL
jgi:hypothetical protein